MIINFLICIFLALMCLFVGSIILFITIFCLPSVVLVSLFIYLGINICKKIKRIIMKFLSIDNKKDDNITK